MLTPSSKRQLALLFLASLVGVAADLVGIVSVYPFLSVAATSHDTHRVVELGTAVLLALTFANLYAAWLYWFNNRFMWAEQARLSKRLLEGYLGRPYLLYLQQGTALATKTILSDVNAYVFGGLQSWVRIVTKGLLILIIALGLVRLDPYVALGSVVFFGGIYAGIHRFAQRRFRRSGERKNQADTLRHKFLAEALSGVRELKVMGRESWALERFATQTELSARIGAYFMTVAEVPRFAIETIAFGGVVAVTMYFVAAGGDLAAALPKVGIFTLAAYRLISALQQVFANVALYLVNRPAIESLRAEMATLSPIVSEAGDRLPLEHSLAFENVSFTYPERDEPVLRQLDLTVEANTTVGLIGTTGAGKSTVAGMVLGLLQPDEGRLLVDGSPIASLPAWQRAIGYVPQDILIVDDTLAANVAFGVPQPDLEAVRKACQLAMLDTFVETELPEGYQTVLGERGVRLSGGQRQRVGIARALYHDPSVLVLDEATSALDEATESAVMEAIRGLSSRKTILLIAHRTSTLAACHNVFRLENGRV